VLAAGVPTWHRAQANESLKAGRWFAAAFHLGRLIEIGPATGYLHYLRGTALAQLARTAEADQEFEKALEQSKDLPELMQADAQAMLSHWKAAARLHEKALAAPSAPPLVWYKYALLCLQRDDRAGYSKACTTLLKRFGDPRNPVIANSVAWAHALSPNALADLTPVVKLAQNVVRANPTSFEIHNTLGADAVAELKTAIKLNESGGTPNDFLFLAMAHHRLGKSDEARTWLDKARQAHKIQPPVFWTDRLEWQLLHQEAEALLSPPGQNSGNKEK
jgi:tetratricopeptide (TPR) repeat protein